MYGMLSKSFAHIGPLHQKPQPVIPYTEYSQGLALNISMLRTVTWVLYVAVELAALGQLQSAGRYWQLKPPNKVNYAPSEAEREWLRQFLRVPKDAA
jgi:hypothetical protein